MPALLYFSKIKSKLSFLIVALFVSLLSINNSGFTHGPVLCIFKYITGHPCPACGSIRSVGALAQGDVISAWKYNPLTLISTLTLFAFIFFPISFSRISNIAEQYTGLKSKYRRNPLIFISIGFILLWVFNLQRW